MTTPADYPPAVAPTETITSTWGNKVVNGVKMPRPFVRFIRPSFATVTENTDYLVTLTGLAEVVDPLGMITTNGLVIPANWGGQWFISYSGAWTTTVSVTCVNWYTHAGMTDGLDSSISLAATTSGVSSSAVVKAAAADLVSFYARYNAGSTTGAAVALTVTAAWQGLSL